jgi:hypothetical protein
MRLSNYLKGQMRMSHIYQPVMIWTLLDKGGKASIHEIAREIAGYDEAMLEYYEERVKNMVGKVLTKNKITARPLSDRQSFELSAIYSEDEIEELKDLCEKKISNLLKEETSISGTIVVIQGDLFQVAFVIRS